jgi:type 1 fimbria pilin
MPNALVHQDLVVGYRNGGARDGTPNFSGTVTAQTCNVQSLGFQARPVEIDQTGPCDTFDNLRSVRVNEEIRLTTWVPTTGPVWKSQMNQYVELTFQSYASGDSYVVVCVLIEYDFNSSNGQNQTETMRFRRIS